MKFKKKNTAQLLIVAIGLGLSAVTHADFGVRADVVGMNGYKNLDDDVGLMLGIEYRGDKFNLGKDGISYNFSGSEKMAVEALLTSKNYGFEAKDSKTFTGMDKRSTSVDLGARVIVDTGVGPVVFDITKDFNKSKGYEAGIKVGGIAPHAPHWTGKKEVMFAAAAGLRYQSEKVVDYFYGVKGSEATATRAAYKGKSALTPYVGVDAQVNLTEHITFDGSIGVSKRASAIRNSPLTKDNKYQGEASIGFSYWF